MPPPRETPRVLDIAIHNKCRCVDKAEMDKRQRTKSTTTCQKKKNNKENCRCISPGYLHLFLGHLSLCLCRVLGYMCPELESLECSCGHSDIDTSAGASFFLGMSVCLRVRVCLIGTIRSQSQCRGKYSFKINTY